MEFRIKEARIAANLTQDQLANLLGIKNTTLSGYETGAHDPKSNTLIEIARICGTTVDYLLGISANFEADKESDPAISDGIDEKEREWLTVYSSLTPSNRRLLLGIAELLLQEQAADPDAQG